ncbi:MAG: HesA/MoeB/ThiF family protein [Pseudomonadota bacterium]
MRDPASIDLERHKRHILLKEIGGPGVQKLNRASVSIVGAGALGGPCALYLAAAGVGQIEIVDDDAVDLSNLQRQVQYSETDIGASKAETLAAKLSRLNSDLSISVRPTRFALDKELSGDILIDATDNFESRFALNRLAHTSGRMLVSGAASRWAGQVSVFASGIQAGMPCYQCFVPETPPEAASCDEIGVVGAVTGIVGTRMALETAKIIIRAGRTLTGKLWLFDGLDGTSRTVALNRDPDCQTCG